MENVNTFYKTYSDDDSKNEFDIENLGDSVFRGMGVIFSDGRGNTKGGEIFTSPPTSEDYDKEFYNQLLKIKPAYKVEDYLDYHFTDYLKNNPRKVELFIKHIEFVILPMLEDVIKDEYSKITNIWINKNKRIMLQKQLQEKNEFLKKGYEEAYNYAPESPLSVDINPIELGKSIGFDKAIVSRIMHELVGDGYATSTLGMRSLFITPKGLNYLRTLEIEPVEKLSSIYVNAGHNSSVQVQNGTTYSSQKIEIKEIDKEELQKLILEIKTGLRKLSKHLSDDQLNDLVAEVDYLEVSLKRSKVNPSLINILKTNIFEILKAVPSNIIANIVTSGM